jgi:hypothetical protein
MTSVVTDDPAPEPEPSAATSIFSGFVTDPLELTCFDVEFTFAPVLIALVTDLLWPAAANF